jgi:hypothetical protein
MNDVDSDVLSERAVVLPKRLLKIADFRNDPQRVAVRQFLKSEGAEAEGRDEAAEGSVVVSEKGALRRAVVVVLNQAVRVAAVSVLRVSVVALIVSLEFPVPAFA